MRSVIIFIFISVLLLSTVQVFAEILEWTDDRGEVHYTDDEKKIPEKYREQAEETELKEPIVQSDYTSESPGEILNEEEKQEFDGKPVLYWIQEINRMESDLIEAENTVLLLANELESLKHLKIGQVRRNPIVGKFYSRPISNEDSLYYVDENEKNQLEMKLKQVEQQANGIMKELMTFKENARKAGVPPKYL